MESSLTAYTHLLRWVLPLLQVAGLLVWKIKLTTNPFSACGARGEIRTPDTVIKSHVLCQLSYTGKLAVYARIELAFLP